MALPFDDVLVSATKNIIDYSIFGSIAVLLAAGMILLIRHFKAELAKKDEVIAKKEAETEKERESHDETRAAHLSDVRDFARIGETIREQQRALETTIKLVLENVNRRQA